jgi:hypothetical protein
MRTLSHSACLPACLPPTEVKYPLLRACSSSAALTAAGLHTHVRSHRTSSDPAYLHTYVYLYMKREEEECCYFRNPGLKRKNFRVTVSLKPRPRNPGLKGLSGNGFTKTVTPHLRSIVPNVQRHMAYFAPPSRCLLHSHSYARPACGLRVRHI